MLGRVIAACLLAFPFTSVLGAGQFPVVDGVPGGAPEGFIPGTRQVLERLAEQPPVNGTTPGKLRYVENSGVCGTCIFSAQCVNTPRPRGCMQRRRRAFTRHPDTAM
jgi:hypothetical protein